VLIMGIGIIFTVLGWVLAVLLGEVTLSCAYRITSARWRFLPRWSPLVPDAGWLLPELTATGCAVLLTLVGALRVLTGAIAAVTPFAAAAVPLARVMLQAMGQRQGGYAARRIASRLLLLIRTAPALLWEDLRALTGRRRDADPRPSAVPQQPAPSSAPAAAPAAAAAPREVPPIREDPALGTAPQPADVAAGLATAGVEIPEPWAQLIAWVGSRVPEDSNDQNRFLLGDAAGFIGLGEAYHAHGATVVDEIGLDPAYGAAILDIGDAVADKSGDVIQGYRRFHLIYEAIVKAVENGVIMPFNGRFFGAGDGAAPQDGPSESAA
jgi:hypothetical protein